MKIARLLTFADLFFKFAINFKGVARKVKHPIVISQEGAYTKLMVVEDADNRFNIRAGVNLALNMAAMSPGHQRSDWVYKIRTIWGDSSMVSIYIFGAALAVAGRLVCDTQVSPAAQMVIKGYWEKHKDDPEYVVPEVLAQDVWNIGAPWLRAGYLAGPIGDAFSSAIAAGEEIASQTSVQELSKVEKQLWLYHYDSNSDTKMLDPKALRETNWLAQQGVQNQDAVIQALERGENVNWREVLPEHMPDPMPAQDLPPSFQVVDSSDFLAQRLDGTLNQPQQQYMPEQEYSEPEITWEDPGKKPWLLFKR